MKSGQALPFTASPGSGFVVRGVSEPELFAVTFGLHDVNRKMRSSLALDSQGALNSVLVHGFCVHSS